MAILCPYCSKELDVELEDYYYSQGCDTCGYGEEFNATITIKCESCKKIIYKKECSK